MKLITLQLNHLRVIYELLKANWALSRLVLVFYLLIAEWNKLWQKVIDLSKSYTFLFFSRLSHACRQTSHHVYRKGNNTTYENKIDSQNSNESIFETVHFLGLNRFKLTLFRHNKFAKKRPTLAICIPNKNCDNWRDHLVKWGNPPRNAITHSLSTCEEENWV